MPWRASWAALLPAEKCNIVDPHVETPSRRPKLPLHSKELALRNLGAWISPTLTLCEPLEGNRVAIPVGRERELDAEMVITIFAIAARRRGVPVGYAETNVGRALRPKRDAAIAARVVWRWRVDEVEAHRGVYAVAGAGHLAMNV